MGITYVVVHKDLVDDHFMDYPDGLSKSNELDRIVMTEPHVRVDGMPNIVPSGLRQEDEILVCGAYSHMCVRIMTDALLRAGFNARIHEAGTIGQKIG